MTNKTNIPGYVKDPNTGLVTNENEHEYELYKLSRKKFKKEKTLEARINNMENDLSEIKHLLQRIISG